MSRRTQFLLIALWCILALGGLHMLMRYKGTAGTAGQTPERWPDDAGLLSPKERPVLIMFAHPQCPCTKASIAELETLAAQAAGQFQATVLFYEPTAPSAEWTNTASVNSASAIPGVRVLFDKEGTIARRFGAETSGHTVLYGTDGKLQFAGGITGSRGHLGDNAGLQTVLSLVQNNRSVASRRTTPVFGCGLFDECTLTQTSTSR